MLTRIFFALVLGLVAAAGALAQNRSGAPAGERTADRAEDVVGAFYKWVLAHPSAGIPAPTERPVLAELLAPSLNRLLERAAETEARCAKSVAPGEKPLLIEGDLFVGNYEGATEVAYGPLRTAGERRRLIDVNLIHVDDRFPKSDRRRAVAWRDRLELGQIGGRWTIQEIRFARSPSLSAGLNQFIALGASCKGVPP